LNSAHTTQVLEAG